jgi:hypothetical protein
MPESAPAHDSTPAAASLSAQIAAMRPGTWARITGENAAYDVDPANNPATNARYPGRASYAAQAGYKSVWDVWTTGTLIPRGPCGSIAYWGGGQTAYWGNQVTALNLCGGTNGQPKWEMLGKPTDDPYMWTEPYTKAYHEGFPDGTPPPVHNYDTLLYAPSANAIVTLMSHGGIFMDSSKAWLFDLEAERWSTYYTHKGAHYGFSAWDSKRKLVWFSPQSGLAGEFTSFDPVTKEFVYYGNGQGHNQGHIGRLGSQMGYDPIHDKLVVTSFRPPVHQVNIAEKDPGLAREKYVEAKIVNLPDPYFSEHVMAWSPARRAWIYYSHLSHDAKVWEMKRSTPGGQLTYTFTPLTSDANTVNPIPEGIHPNNGIWDKYQLITVDGTELLIGQYRLPDGIYAFRLPAPSTTAPSVDPRPVEPPLPNAEICKRDGVFHCEMFDDAIIEPAKLYTGTTMPVVEDGRLVMQIPELSGANPGGDYRITFPAVGPGKMLAFSFRVKADTGAVSIAGRKHFVLWGGRASCTGLELAQTHHGSAVVMPYTECGATNTYIPIAGTTDYRLHYPDYDCKYQQVKAGNFDGCVISVADVWDHFYIEIAMGEPDTPTSRLTMWHKKEGEKWRRYIHRTDWTFRGSKDSQNGWNNLMLTPYVTGKDPTVASPNGRVEYDELVMSTKPFLEALR